MISAFLQIKGILTPVNVIRVRPLEGKRSSVVFRLSSPIDPGLSLVLQTVDGQCMECVTVACTAEAEHYVVELRCLGDAGFLAEQMPLES